MRVNTNNFAKFLKARKQKYGEQYPRKPLDEILEYLRFTKVEPYIPKNATLLDIGTGDGNFLQYIHGKLKNAVGIDAHLKQNIEVETCLLVSGYFPRDFEVDTTFDVITMMAVAEHIPMNTYPHIEKACWKYLKNSGQLIITVQHPRVERLLDWLKNLKIVEGFSIYEHYGFNPDSLPDIFYRWKLIKREQWGFRCNNLFIFKKYL